MSAVEPRSRMLGVTLLALAGCLVALSALGPLIGDVIEWRINAIMLNQLYGLDAVSLLVVTPTALVAGLAALRGRRAGPLLGFGPAAYTAYMVPQYVLGPDYAHLPATTNAGSRCCWRCSCSPWSRRCSRGR